MKPPSAWLRWVPVAFALGFIALLAFRPVMDSDTGFHLAVGEWIWNHHAIPGHDPLVPAAESRAYVNFGWLYQLLLRGIFAIGGYPGLSWLHAAVIVAVFALLADALRGVRLGPVAVAVWLVLAALMCERRFFTRPEIFSWLLLLLTLRWCGSARHHPALLAAIFLAWPQFHGLFAIGWLALGAWAVEAWWSGRVPRKKVALCCGLALLATALSPMGLRAFTVPFAVLLRQADPAVTGMVGELLTPWGRHADGSLLWAGPLASECYYVYALSIPLLLCIAWRRRRWVEIFALAAGLLLSISAQRMIPFFILWTLPAVARMISETLSRWPARAHWWHCAAVSLLIAMLGWRVMNGAHYTYGAMRPLFGSGLVGESLGEPAARFVRERLPAGAVLLNDFNSGSWLAWSARRAVSIHGNLEILGPDALRAYAASLQPGGLAPLLAQRRPDAVVFTTGGSFPWLEQLGGMPGWRCVFLDGNSAVFVRDGLAPGLPKFQWRSLSREVQGRAPPPTPERYLALLAEPRPWLHRFFFPQPHAPATQLPDLSRAAGEYAVAEQLYLDLLRQRPCNVSLRGTRINIAQCYDHLGEASKALIAYGKLAADDPADAQAAALVGRIEAHVQPARAAAYR